MPFFGSVSFLLALASSALAAALVPVPTAPQPTLPAAGLEVNQGQAKAGVLFLCPGAASSLAVTVQSVLYSPLGVALNLVASNPNALVSFSDPLHGLVNSYTGTKPQQWVTGVVRYGTATLTGVYPKVNVQYTVDASGILTLNLLVGPGIDPSSVHFQIPAAISITALSNGSLTAQFGADEFAPQLGYPAPTAVQPSASGNISRTASFSLLSSTTFGVAVQGIDPSLPVQISLALNSPAVFGVAPSLGATTQVSDTAGNTYLAATIADAAGKNPPFPTIGGSGCGNDIEQPVPCSDVAVYKYSAAGVLQFVTYLSGETDESAGFIGLAPNGSLVVAGTTNSADFPVTSAAAQPDYTGPPASPTDFGTAVSGDFFAAILNTSTGFLQSATFLGGPNADTMGTAALGSDGSLYFLPVSLGQFSAGMPVTSRALLSSCQSDPCQNGYVARLSPALDQLIFGTYLPGEAQATAQLYSDGSVYYAGTATAGFPSTPNAYQTQNAGGYDGIVARLDPTGSKLLFATYFGGPNTDWIYPIAVAPDGSVWAGVSSFIACCINIQWQLIHLDADGSKLLAELPIYTDEMVVNPAGNLFVLAEGPVTVSPGALLGGSCGGDAYVELSPAGQQLFATYLPVQVNGFAGADAEGTPYLATASGSVQVVENESGAVKPSVGCLVDAASFGTEQAVSPGEIVTIFGSGLGPDPGVGFQLVNGHAPASLGGTQVLIDGEPAPILYSSYGQLNLILPYSLTIGAKSTIEVVSNGTSANVISNLEVQAGGIVIFEVNGVAAALNQDGTVNSPQNPAQPGSTVMLFGTGGGQTNPPSVAGAITPVGLQSLIAATQVEVAYLSNPPSSPGLMLKLEYAGAAPELLSGVTQVNVTLPEVIPVTPFYSPGTLPLWVLTNGQSFGYETVTIFVAY